MPKEPFRRFVRKYLITGLPLIIMPEAATSGDAVWTPAQWQANSDQLRVAVEFNVPVAFYWVYGTGCHFGGNRGAPQTQIDRINQWVWKYIQVARRLPKNYSGNKSADLAVGRIIELGPTEGGKFVYTDAFANEKCVDDAAMTGFRNLVLNGQTLSARGFRGRRVNTSLTYHFAGEYDARYPKVSLDTTTDKSLNGAAVLSISLDGKTWSPATATTNAGAQNLTVVTDHNSSYAKVKDFFVRITIQGAAGNNEQPCASIDNLRVEAELIPPKDLAIELKPIANKSNKVAYQDTFESQRYQLTTSRTNEQHLEWSPGTIGVRMRPGGSQAVVVWKVKSPQPLGNIRVAVTGKANVHSLGTNHYLDISLDGKTWLHEVNTVGKPGDVNGWVADELQIALPDDERFQNVNQFFVRLRLTAQSYHEPHPNLSGAIKAIRIEAETAIDKN